MNIEYNEDYFHSHWRQEYPTGFDEVKKGDKTRTFVNEISLGFTERPLMRFVIKSFGEGKEFEVAVYFPLISRKKYIYLGKTRPEFRISNGDSFMVARYMAYDFFKEVIKSVLAYVEVKENEKDIYS